MAAPSPVGAAVSSAGDAAASGPTPAAAADECLEGIASGSFNQALAIGSIFVVAAASFFGFTLPIILRRHGGRFTHVAVTAASAAGTGVLLTVALVHILSDAEESLSSPCAPKSLRDAYPNWASLFCAATIMGMILLDFVLQGIFERKFERQEEIVAEALADLDAICPAASPTASALHLHGTSALALSRASTLDLPLHGAAGAALSEFLDGVDGSSGGGGGGADVLRLRRASRGASFGGRGSLVPSPHGDLPPVAEAAGGRGCAPLLPDDEPVAVPPAAAAAASKDPELGGKPAKTCKAAGKKCDPEPAFAHSHSHSHSNGSGEDDLPEAAALALKRGAVLFIEGSVCTHSIPVGLALGMQTAANFIGLFVAVVLHQMLEGLGVGAAAAEARYPLLTLGLLAGLFSVTAPLGIALGIGLRSVMSPSDPRYLVSLGVVNSIAAGMLIYVAIEHMNAIGAQGRWLRRQHWAAQASVMLAFAAGGAALMALGVVA